MRFTKMQGAGNDYVFIDARKLSEDWAELSRKMSDRHFGIGGDGIILILDSDVADLKMRMFNADGSEGEMCGNGIRCFTKYAIEHEISPNFGSALKIETLAGIRTVEPVYAGGRVTRARVAMGAPEFRPANIPVALDPAITKANPNSTAPVTDYPLKIGDRQLALTFVSMGNPHAVAFIDEPVSGYPLQVIGPKLEHHPMFPKRVNFEIVNLNGEERVTARVWERGSGETMACGTGACAIAVAARLQGLTHGPLDITLPGGTLTINWDGEGEVYLEGPAEEAFSGEWEIS
jgi:diaminopimelate epimerase